MSTAAAKLLSQFDALKVEDKQEFMREAMLHIAAWDSGALSDDVAAAAGDDIAAMLDQEERRAS